jgi:Cu/Ag efflux pump CusA
MRHIYTPDCGVLHFRDYFLEAIMMRQSINKTIATLVVASLGVFSLSTIARQDETQRQIVQQAIKAKKSCCSTFWLDYNMRVAVAVGFIALAGVAAETDVIML